MTVEISVKGKVQGVFYRASTQGVAKSLGLNGYVKNLEDGSVQIEAQGDKDKLLELIEWCEKGPPAAEVDSVNWTEIEEKDYSKFTIQ